MAEKGVLLGTGLERGLLYGSLERTHMRLELPVVVVFECQHGTLRGLFHRASAALISSFTVGTRKTAGGRWACAWRARSACLASPRSQSSLGSAWDWGGYRVGGGLPSVARSDGSSLVGAVRSMMLTASRPSHAE